MQVKEIVGYLEEFAPLNYQESYDNSGLIVGSYSNSVKSALITLDVTEEIIDEAITKGCDLIISHHPIIMGGIKRLNGSNYIERCLIKAIENKIAIYACHTNVDNVATGVNKKICDMLNLSNCEILQPLENSLTKIVCFAPISHANKVREAMFSAGAGNIGNYSSCSFNTQGEGTFMAKEGAKPFVGELNDLHSEEEQRIETIVPSYLQKQVVNAMLDAHPYEEVAYDLYSLKNKHLQVGSGMMGYLSEPCDELEFLKQIKETFKTGCIRHTKTLGNKIKKVAVCGGSGSFLLNKAISAKADIFISGDFKYHQFFDAENKIIIADIGHFESEQYTKDLFFDILTKKIPNFAVYLSEVNTNPIKYL